MDRTERFYKIKELLRQRKVVSFADLQAELEVSRSTLKRDIAYLSTRSNNPIAWTREAGGYRLVEEAGVNASQHELPGLWFSAPEIHALLTMQHLLANPRTGGLLTTHIAPLMDRLNALLGDDGSETAELRRRVRIVGLAQRTVELRHVKTFGTALVQPKRLRITYLARGTGESTERDISPSMQLLDPATASFPVAPSAGHVCVSPRNARDGYRMSCGIRIRRASLWLAATSCCASRMPTTAN